MLCGRGRSVRQCRYSQYNSGAPAASAPPPAGSEVVPAGWEALSSGEGYTYYYNKTTGVSQWEKPEN